MYLPHRQLRQSYRRSRMLPEKYRVVRYDYRGELHVHSFCSHFSPINLFQILVQDGGGERSIEIMAKGENDSDLGRRNSVEVRPKGFPPW
jgi:hypothetical protein